MATSPNFGWAEPDNTDLVKNGALAIRTLGNAIDSSMVDLLGGTTGQVLSKASNTNMDFTWVTTDDANAIQNSIVDAKGDLIAATANDTPARLAVGANGEMLVADSTAATGLDWKTATEQYPWQGWTPTFTNISLGNGTVVARYQQIRKTVNVEFQLTFGSTTTITNPPYISVPVTMKLYGNIAYYATYLDSGTAEFVGYIGCPNGALFEVACQLASTTYAQGTAVTSTVPFTWTTGDRISFRATYEAV
jgi:hypothetical protein